LSTGVGAEAGDAEAATIGAVDETALSASRLPGGALRQ
jgi:hypothetical protein